MDDLGYIKTPITLKEILALDIDLNDGQGRD
jgi:hypothetical protein